MHRRFKPTCFHIYARLLAFILLVALQAVGGGTASAAAPVNPDCQYKEIDIQKYGLNPYADAPVIRSGADHVLTATLDIAYTDPAKTSIAGCPVHLRTYNGALIGPTLRVKPGDTMKITVANHITQPKAGKAAAAACDAAGMDHGAMGMKMKMVAPPAVYDITNLHTHGLHVSPSGNSDNVFLEICPGQSQDYEIRIPADHPAGTFWYHAHLHGSTALQVSSGMEGALIVEGGLDEVPEIKAAAEKTLVLQQIVYDEQGQIESQPGNWAKSKRNITVNGQIAPLLVLRPGEVQRWRLVHGGVKETISLHVSNETGGDSQFLYEIATDGNTLGRIDAWRAGDNALELDPGYRSDVLFKAPPLADGRTSARYYLFSGMVTGKNSLSFVALPNPKLLTTALGSFTPQQVVAVIDVKGQPMDMSLPSDAELAPLAPYKPIADSELNGAPQSLSFSIESLDCSQSGPCRPCPPGKNCKTQFMVDHYSYPNGPVRDLKLGTASQWALEVDRESLGATHPYHIHVNPFQMVRVGPNGADETVWKDTLLVKKGQDAKYRTIRSRYETFTGKFVLHCHILDHEDGGMMQEVEILP